MNEKKFIKDTIVYRLMKNENEKRYKNGSKNIQQAKKFIKSEHILTSTVLIASFKWGHAVSRTLVISFQPPHASKPMLYI